jgi:hypothetical protein
LELDMDPSMRRCTLPYMRSAESPSSLKVVGLSRE